ncbi:zinc finger protein 436-like [Thalassophryne amazonica]|uniref:zinc finger protein 436-like n=1 Tax=Thalassophryne amazonica TaxID=390379 RepID=UPI001470DFB4|nr:zinc finger protein 436-like [Thalassophryne amazonica]
MSKVQMLRALVKQRLTAAAEEIFGLFERTIAEYEEELCRSKEENHRQRHLLDAVFNPDVHLQAAELHQESNKADVPPDQQIWSADLDRGVGGLSHIKEEQHEAESIMSCVPVTSEDHKEKTESSQFHQRQTEESREAEPQATKLTEPVKRESDGEDCGESEPDTNPDPGSDLQLPDTCHNISDFSDSDDDWKESRKAHLNRLKNTEIVVSDRRRKTHEKPFHCSECEKRFGYKKNLQRHLRIHTGEKLFSCSICGKMLISRAHLTYHMRCHTGEKPFSCSACQKSFRCREALVRHMRIHTGEKLFHCYVCGKGFAEKTNLTRHLRVHTGYKK